MKILITNDDGINADGLIRLSRAAMKYGEVWVVAPDGQRSAASHSISLHNCIDVYPVDFPVEGVHAFSSTGTPADCIRVGVLNIVPNKPDIIFSGINFGYNAGSDVQYSATVGAAMEGVFQGIPSVAFSEGYDEAYMITNLYLEKILDEVVNTTYKYGEIVNVNFPTAKPEEFKGILRDRFVSRGCVFKDSYTCEELANGGKRYMVNGQYNEDVEDGSDLKALFDKYISIGTVTNIS